MPEESAQAKKGETPSQRGRSTIDFPYLDLDNAIEIVQAVRNLGHDRCTVPQLATKLNVSAEGGGFRMRLLAAKTFGLLSYERGNIELTSLGIRAADPVTEKRGRLDAFLFVGLFGQLFTKLDGQTLPPTAAIERMMELLGVAAKQKERARQVFLRSAKQAGLFELSSDRLSIPPMASNTPLQPPQIEIAPPASRGGGGDEPPTALHPFISGLLKTLPPPDTAWTPIARLKWLQAAANIFDLIYTTGDNAQEGMNINIKLTTNGEAGNA